MTKLVYNRESEQKYPHAPDLAERGYAENGFASGWAMHAKPVPKYYFDSHVHYSGKKDNIPKSLFLPTHIDVARMLVIFQICGKKWDCSMRTENIMDSFSYFGCDELKGALDLFSGSDKLFWSAYLNYQSSEKELVRNAAAMGARCVKLHNAPQIEDNAPADLWMAPDWQNCFEVMAELKLPVLWHVTQRLPTSVYTGGKGNVYWEKGWKNGVKYNNEDLLQVFLSCCRRHPGVNFIGAHQLHIGWERLEELFWAHPNLYVDTTIGCMLRLYDDFYPHDKEYLRSVFIRWADRIIFGTDTFGKYSESNYLQHIRFIAALELPQEALDKICHKNIERLCGMEEL